MADFSFRTDNNTIGHLSSSGVGLYGSSFLASVRVGEYQNRTFITNSTGTNQGPEGDNVKYVSAPSGILAQAGSGIPLLSIPNAQATVEITFTHSTAVQVNNVKCYFYDRVNKNNNPSGVTVRAAEVIHPDPVQNNNGSGDASWITVGGSGSVLDLAPSPGVSGLYAGNGSNSTRPDTTHNWYVAVSASPDTIGTKLFAMLVECEYF